MKVSRKLAAATFAALSGLSEAATCTALTGTRNWNLAATWTSVGNCNRVPTTADTVVIPNLAIITLDTDTVAVISVQVNAGGVLQGDGTGKILLVAGAGNPDIINNGKIDFRGIVGAAGSSTAAVLMGNGTALNFEQTTGVASEWLFSTIDFGGAAATFEEVSAIEFNGHGSPFQDTGGNITNNSGGTVLITWTFSGTVAQIITAANITRLAGAGGRIWRDTTHDATITVTNSSATGLVIQAPLQISGNLNVTGGTLTLEGTATAMVTAAGYSFNAASTVRYARTNTMTVMDTTYGNLEILGGSAKTADAGAFVIAGNFTLAASTTWTGTNNPTMTLRGNFENLGTYTSGTGLHTFNGAAAQTLKGTTSIANVTINNTAGSTVNRTLSLVTDLATPVSDLTVTGTLTFTAGRIVTAGNKVIIPSTGTVAGAAAGTGWVAGRLQKFVAAGASAPTFQVGTDGASAPSLAYTPVVFAFTGVGAGGGALIVYPTLADHSLVATSGVDGSLSVNRTWLLTTTGVTGTALPAFTSYSATFNFVASDLDGGAAFANFNLSRYFPSAWSATTPGTRAATSTQATGVTALGEFQIGEPVSFVLTKVSSIVSDPISGVTNPKSIPDAIREYTVSVTNPSFITNSNTVVITDPVPTNAALYVASAPVVFTNGAPVSGLTFTYTSLASTTDNVDFSNDGGATWLYTPTAGANGCDTAVTNIRARPQGTFTTGIGTSPQPSFTLKFRVCVK